jgi:hypothetical protein
VEEGRNRERRGGSVVRRRAGTGRGGSVVGRKAGIGRGGSVKRAGKGEGWQ